MVVKFFTVVAYFMHLKFDNRLFSLLFYTGPVPGGRRLLRRPVDVPLLRQLTLAARHASRCVGEADAGWRSTTGAGIAAPWSTASTRSRVRARGASSCTPRCWCSSPFLIGAYVYMVRVRRPARRRAPASRSVTRRNVGCFVGAMPLLCVASDWPIHDIGEQYLYSVAHAPAHDAVATSCRRWRCWPRRSGCCARSSATAALYRVVRWFCHPVVAGVLFNVAVMVTHIPGVVDASRRATGPLHYSLHVMVVMTALLMWMPVCGPFPEFHIGTAGQDDLPVPESVVPTVPAGWLTFADGVGVQAVRRAAGAAVGPVGHHRPAARRGDDEDRRVDLPVDDHRLPVVQALLGVARRRRARLPAAAARCPTSEIVGHDDEPRSPTTTSRWRSPARSPPTTRPTDARTISTSIERADRAQNPSAAAGSVAAL